MTSSPATIPVAKPSLGEAEAEAARRVILSGWVTQGPEVAAFEQEFREFVAAPHACAVSSCTAALHLALRGVGVGPGDEVITVSHSFIATANCVRYCGAVPVFVDVEPGTGCIDPDLITAVVSERTKAILCVHQLGIPCDIGRIVPLSRRLGLAVVEDAACAIGSEVLYQGRWERLGRPHGDAACFSFHPRKLLTTGDGGMITTSNPTLDQRLRLWRQHGMGVPDLARHRAKSVMLEDYRELGYNYRLTDIQAAVGRVQLQKLPALLDRRRAQVQRYRELLAATGVRLPSEPPWGRANWQSFAVGLPPGCDQRAVMESLLAGGISTRRGVMCAHREPAYVAEEWSCGSGPGPCGCPRGRCRRLTRSEEAQDTTIILPLFDEMTEADQHRVALALSGAIRGAR